MRKHPIFNIFFYKTNNFQKNKHNIKKICRKHINFSTYLSYFWTFIILLLEQKYYWCVYDIRTKLNVIRQFIFSKHSLISMELNFFDTNLLGSLLEALPIWDRNLYVSLCIEVLHDQSRTEPVVVVRVAVSDVRI